MKQFCVFLVLLLVFAAGCRQTAARVEFPLVFVRDGDICTARSDGTGLTRLTTDGQNAFPMWSPDGRYIAFSRAGGKRVNPNYVSPTASLWVMRADGSEPRVLREAKEFEAFYPAAWLPDGSGLLVTLHLLESDAPSELMVVMRNGGQYPNIRKWTNAVNPNTTRRDPNWFTTGNSGAFSPDGRGIVFSRLVPVGDEQRYRTDIYRMKIDGTDLRRLASLPDASIKTLRWSDEILSSEARYKPGTPEEEIGLWLRDADGRTERKLIDLPTASYSGAGWLPDGEEIVYQLSSKDYPGLGGGVFEHPTNFHTMSRASTIRLIRADGTGDRVLLKNACHPNWR